MAKVSMIQREIKRAKCVAKYAKKRDRIKEIIKNINTPESERWQAILDLQKLPRNSSAVRMQRRCTVTGRPRGTYRRFNLCRNKLRQAVMNGEISGVFKASW